MTPTHKPGPGPGLNGILNGKVYSKHFNRTQRPLVNFIKLVVGVFCGLILTVHLQKVLTLNKTCKKVSQPASHPRLQLDVPVSREEETTERQLLLVGVMTADKYIDTRARAVYETWGRLVSGKILFFTAYGTNASSGLPIVPLPGVDDSYPPQKKSFLMLKYMKDHYGNKFEWFMRADDDVYVKTDQLEQFLRNINSSKAAFIGQAGKGIQEEFGLLSLEYDENFCMGGPGIILSHVTLSRVAPHVKDCLKNLYTTHEDVELGRCVQKYAGIPCTWSYEMQNIFYHNSSGRLAFTGSLKSREVHRAITLHPIKQHAHMYRVHNYVQSLNIQELVYDSLKVRREMANSVNELRKRIGPEWNENSVKDLSTLGIAPTLNKFIPADEDEIIPWNFLSRAAYSLDSANPRRKIEVPLREGIDDVVREVMEGINTLSKERGRIIDFKEILYGYYRVNPMYSVDYILDMLLVYKKYRGRKMTVPVRRHAYLQQPFGPLQVHWKESFSEKQSIYFVLPLSGRLQVFERFMKNFENVCLMNNENVKLVIVLYPTFTADDPIEHIKDLIDSYKLRYSSRFQVDVYQQSGKFARAAALEVGASKCLDDCLLMFIDVDMVFSLETLYRIRMHTVRGKQVYFPIVFSQYDPNFLRQDETQVIDVNQLGAHSFDIHEDKGYWRFYGFGIASLYRSDLQQVGGFNISIQGWGQEDVDLFDKVVRSNLTIFRSPDPGLIHIFHSVQCDEDLQPKQREMCLGTRANIYASQRRLARYYLENVLSKNNV